MSDKPTDNETFVRHVQARLGVAVDGWAGPRTRAAFDAALPAPAPLVMPPPPVEAPRAPGLGVFNSTSEDRLRGVHPALVRVMRDARESHVFDVIEGLRTRERQQQLVAQGASKTLNSRHLTGHAVDLWPVDPATGKRVTHPDPRERDRILWAHLTRIAATVKQIARDGGVMLEWGGDWGWDAPHFQLNRAGYPA